MSCQASRIMISFGFFGVTHGYEGVVDRQGNVPDAVPGGQFFLVEQAEGHGGVFAAVPDARASAAAAFCPSISWKVPGCFRRYSGLRTVEIRWARPPPLAAADDIWLAAPLLMICLVCAITRPAILHTFLPFSEVGFGYDFSIPLGRE